MRVASMKNRITAQIIGQLLYKIRNMEKFALLYQGLPVSGVSGTLKERLLQLHLMPLV